MADVITGVTEITNVSQNEIMGNMVQQYLQAAAMFPQRITTMVAPTGLKSVAIPRTVGFIVDSKLENTAVNAQALTWSVDTLLLNQHRVIQVLLEDIADIQSKVDQELAIAERAGLDLAYDVDLRIVTELYTAVSIAAPDHLVAFAAANALTAADLLTAKRLLDIQNVPQDGRYFAVNPIGYSQLLSVSDFVRFDAIAANQVNVGIRPGVIGNIYGFEVFMSQAVVTAQNIAFHKSALAYGVQQGVTYKTQEQVEHLAMRHSFSQLFGLKGLDLGKRHVVIGSGAIAS